MPSLIETKFIDIKGLERNSNQPDRQSNLLRATNIETHQKPGTMTLRPGYELRYPKPTDDRIENAEYVSFDNFFERDARDGTEITVEVVKGEIVSPVVDGEKITNYKLRSANIFIRPHWTGSYWQDSWEWMNETNITKVTAVPPDPSMVRYTLAGQFDNLAQWTAVNVTKNKLLPIAVLKSTTPAANTTYVWLSVFSPGWEVDDVIVLMKNYVPIANQINNYDVNREQISFYRILSKIRIGFGGISGRLAYGIEYVKNTIQLDDYAFPTIDPLLLGSELIFAHANRMILQPYTLFNQNNLDFVLDVLAEAGDFDPGTYYFRMTGMLDASDEILMAESEIVVGVASKFRPNPRIRLGSFNRRLTAVKIYFSTNGDDYYLFQDLPVSVEGGQTIDAKNMLLRDDGYLEFKEIASAVNIFTEPNAAAPSDDNAVGSWITLPTYGTIGVVAATNFAIRALSNAVGCIALFPLDQLDEEMKTGKRYTIILNCKHTAPVWSDTLNFGFLGLDGVEIVAWVQIKALPITTSYVTYTFEIIFGDISAMTHIWFQMFSASLEIESLTITEKDSEFIAKDTELGAQDLVEMGYLPTFNHVRDWMDAVVLNGKTYVVGAFIEKRFDNDVFSSEISGLSANMHDIITAQNFFPVDRYKGEVIVGLAVLSNNNLAVLKDGSVIILDPETGQIYEAAIGYGAKIKNTILVFRGTLIYGSNEDFIKMSAPTGYEAIQISDRYIRDIYQALPDKTKAHACFDRYGNYRVALTNLNQSSAGDAVGDLPFPELLLTDRGWLDQKRYHHPQVYRNGLAGRVWFMNEGDIYAFPFDESEYIGYADVYGNWDSGW